MAERLKPLGFRDGGAEMWKALGASDPKTIEDRHGVASIAIAEHRGVSRHDAR